MILQKCSLWKVLEIFFIEPTKSHFVKEISKKIKLAPTSVKKHLSNLVEMGFIDPVKGDLYVGYKAKRENTEFIFYKKISNLIQLKKSKLLEKLKEKYPSSIILFGSYDKGEDIESSDIDIFINSKKFKLSLENYEKALNRVIHLIFKNEATPRLMKSINNGTIIFGER
jgi:predicted nucleotidyltransferase